ncbi:glycosyltransferase [uncultured Devosia sp.]|uniref:glycosyltransferase n=1 Tax=uncultured Devosia sp. TaxID=211434 RepID=UPI0035CBC6A8
MRIALVCNDTRGGIQPYVALAKGLRDAGHTVRVIAPGAFSAMVLGAGLPMAPLSGHSEDLLRTGGAERGTLAAIRMMRQHMPRMMANWTVETLDACADMDMMVGGVGGMVIGLAVAEKLGIPFIAAHLQPIAAPSSAYPGVLLANVPDWLGPLGRRASHSFSDAALWMSFKPVMARTRRQALGLTGRPKPADDRLALYGFSNHVVPMPPAPNRHVTGYWPLAAPADWQPPADLLAFLAQDGPVISIGFGSMANQDAGAVTELVLGAVRDAGTRAVLLSGWGGLRHADSQENVFWADALPHDWLFPRMTAIVHHGGAGTTGAALTAGRPSIIIPYAVDQPFWASRVVAMGVGPKPVPRRRLTRKALATIIAEAIGNHDMQRRAADLGALLRQENGVHGAVTRLGELKLSRTWTNNQN